MIIEWVGNYKYRKRLHKAAESAKSRGVGVSDDHKMRWQIELVFKSWKSFFEINKVKKVKKERMECQLLAKLICFRIVSQNHLKF